MKRPGRKPSGNDYDVGYGKPPRRTQFQAGQSGNPKGRPKANPSISEVFVREAARHVRVRRGDQIEKISKLEAVVLKILQRAIEGVWAPRAWLCSRPPIRERGLSKRGKGCCRP